MEEPRGGVARLATGLERCTELGLSPGWAPVPSVLALPVPDLFQPQESSDSKSLTLAGSGEQTPQVLKTPCSSVRGEAALPLNVALPNTPISDAVCQTGKSLSDLRLAPPGDPAGGLPEVSLQAVTFTRQATLPTPRLTMPKLEIATLDLSLPKLDKPCQPSEARSGLSELTGIDLLLNAAQTCAGLGPSSDNDSGAPHSGAVLGRTPLGPLGFRSPSSKRKRSWHPPQQLSGLSQTTYSCSPTLAGPSSCDAPRSAIKRSRYYRSPALDSPDAQGSPETPPSHHGLGGRLALEAPRGGSHDSSSSTLWDEKDKSRSGPWTEEDKAQLIRLVNRWKPRGAQDWEAVASRLGRWSKNGAGAERMHRSLTGENYAKSRNRHGRRLNDRNNTPLHVMAAYALQQLPNRCGNLHEMGEIIQGNPEFLGMLDTSARPGTKTYPRWMDALIGVFKAGRYPHLGKRKDSVDGMITYCLLSDPPEPKPRKGRARSNRRDPALVE